MGQSWKFIVATAACADAPTWSWVLCSDGRGILKSPDCFHSFLACVTDARLRGFGIADRFDIIRERRRVPREVPCAPRLHPARPAFHP